MPLEPRVKRFLDALAASNPPDALSMPVAQRRASLAQLMQLAGPPVAFAATGDGTLPGPAGILPIRIYTPAIGPAIGASALLPGLVYFHGGGLVAGSIATHDSLAQALAAAGGCRLVSVGYRLAPESPYPAALDDALAAIRYVAAHAQELGIDPHRLGVCGDSAGGTLVAAACQSLGRAGDPTLALQLLICPILDYGGVSASRREFAHGYLVDEATLAHDLRHSLPPGMEAADPRISPLRAQSLVGLPPTIIHTAEYDPLRDEGRAYYLRLEHARSALSYTCHAGMVHLFYGLGGVIPYARTAIDKIGGEIRAALA
jgi:acetyl esterase/lipase